MKWTIIAMAVVLVGLIGFAASKGEGLVEQGFRTAGVTGLKFLPILAVAFVIMGFVDVLLPSEVVERWLSDAAGWRGIGVAWLAGVLTRWRRTGILGPIRTICRVFSRRCATSLVRICRCCTTAITG